MSLEEAVRNLTGGGAEESLSLYNTIFQEVLFPLLIIDAQTLKIVYANKAAQDFTKYTSETCSYFFHGSASHARCSTSNCPIKQVQQSTSPLNFEHEYVNGEHPHKMQIQTLPLLNMDRRVTGVVQIISSSIQCYKMQERLEKNEERMELALAVANDGYFDWDVRANRVFFDNRYYTMAGYAPDEFPASYESWKSRLHPSETEYIEKLLRDYLEGIHDKYDVEFRFRCKEDSWMWIRSKAKIVERDRNGNPVRVVGTHSDVTERKVAEIALRESEDQYRAIFSSGSAIALVSLDGNIIDANPACAKLFEFEKHDEFSGRSVLEFTPEEDREFNREHVSSILQSTQRNIQYEKRLLTQKGRIFYGVISWTRCDRQIKGEHFFTVVVTDITQHHNILRALMNSEEKFRTVADHTFNWEFWISSDGTFKWIAPSVEKITGYPLEWFMGANVRKLLEIIHTDDHEEFKRHLREEVNATGTPYEGDFRIITASGSVRWIAHACLPILSDDKKYLGHRASNRDITAYKELLFKSKENEGRLLQIANNIEEIFWLIDTYGTIKMINKSYSRIFRTDTTPEGTNFWHLPIWEDEERLAMQLVLDNAISEKIPHVSIETNWRKSDNTIRLCRNEVSPVRDENGNVSNFAILTRDITHYRNLAEKEQIHQEQLRQADKMTSLGILVSGVAHEINNPNNLIMLNVAFLGKVWKDVSPLLEREVAANPAFKLNNLSYDIMKDKLPQLLHGISMGSDRIKGIVHSLKEFVRVDTGRLDSIISLNKVVEDAIMIVNNTIKKATRHFSVHYAENMPSVQGNMQQLEQVMVNLLTNSCQALRSRQESITVITSRSGNEVRVVVYDEGIGISKEVKKKMRDPFFTTKRDSGGTGLGLSVSHSIVDAHRGRLEYRSQPGLGTEAHMVLPITDEIDIQHISDTKKL